MDTLVVRPANKPGTQCGRKAFKSCAVPGANAPGATQYQGNGWVGLEHRLQDWNPFEQRMPCSLIRAHVDALAWMPEHFFMVNNAIEIEVQDDVRAAWSGRREIWGNLARGHSHMLDWTVLGGDVVKEDGGARADSELASHVRIPTRTHQTGHA